MKEFILKYRRFKFSRFINGLLFAIISSIALYLCLLHISYTAAGLEVLLPFAIAAISLLMGFFALFYHKKETAGSVIYYK